MISVPESSQMEASQFRSRADLQRLFEGLMAPLESRFSPGCTRIDLGATGARQSAATAGMEAFARSLWGLAPFESGGGGYEGWENYRRGLANGTNPQHVEFWGVPGDQNQKLVELAPIAFALLQLPQLLWEPLSGNEKQQVVAYLRIANTKKYPNNNWPLFRVMVNLALEQLGVGADERILQSDLDGIEKLFAGSGWYRDGVGEPCDLYNAFGFHFYSLLYCKLRADKDRDRCERFEERARQFANQFIQWHAEDGSCVPYGRSMSYRVASSAFWSALVFANVKALPWGAIKGLLFRNLRWWMGKPFLDNAGILGSGYAYPNHFVTEEYISTGSPLWALKAFLCLAVPEEHPFWSSHEEPLPQLPEVVLQEEPLMLVQRDKECRHVVAFSGGQPFPKNYRHAAEKYAKFAYSSHFGFSVPTGARGLELNALDNCLALSEDGDYWRTRIESYDQQMYENALSFTWRPWPDVEVQTWLIAVEKWHVRVHFMRNQRKLESAEGAFAVDRGEIDDSWKVKNSSAGAGAAWVNVPSGACAIYDLAGDRRGHVVQAAPNSNLMAARTLIPTIFGRHRQGEHWLASAVFGDPNESLQVTKPRIAFERTETGFRLANTSGDLVFEGSN